MPFNTNSNNTNYSATTTTTDNIKWVGGDIVCKNKQTGKEEVIVCNGKNLTVVQHALAEKICNLTNSTDISKIEICDDGGYFTEAFKDANSPITAILQEVLDAICTQEGKIKNKAEKDIITTESITITYCCCAPDNCSGVVIATIPQHLKNILDCVCAMRAQLVAITNFINIRVAIDTQIDNLQQQITAIVNSINSFNTINPSGATDIPLTAKPVVSTVVKGTLLTPVSTCTGSGLNITQVTTQIPI